MKCDKLKRKYSDITGPYYGYNEVNEAIAELKEKLHDVDNQWNKQCKEIAQLKTENEQLKAKLETVNELVKTSKDMFDRTIESLKITHDTEMMDAGMRERRLRRALYKVCANWAFAMDSLLTNKILDGNHSDKLRFTRDHWWRMGHKCLKKAEEYI